MFLAHLQRPLALLLVATAALGGVAATAAFPTPAYAASVPTGNFGTGNLTVLPSTAQPLFQGVSNEAPYSKVGQYLYSAMADPKKMAALTQLYRQSQSGTATAAETAELTTAVRATAPIATRTALLTRGVASAAGPAGAVLTSAQVGFMVGGGVSRAMGLDVDGTLCRGGAGGQVLAFVSGTDCGSFWDTVNKTTINSDASTGATGGTVCLPASTGQTACAQWLGTVTNTTYNRMWNSFKASDVQDLDSRHSIVTKDGAYALRAYNTNGDPQDLYFIATNGTNSDRSNCVSGSTGCAYDGQSLKGPQTSTYRWFQVSTGQAVGDLGTISSGTGDPDRVQRCKQTFTDGTSYEASGDPVSLTKGFPEAPDLPVPDGKTVAHIDCEVYTPDGTAPTFKTYDEDTTPEYQKSAAVNPECGSTTVCELQLVKPDGSVCNDTDTTCAGWTTAPDADQWTCRWGNDAVGWRPADIDTECIWYGKRWDADAKASGDTLTAPATSAPSHTPTKVPNPAPASTPGTDASVSNPTVSDGETKAACFPTGWGALNPVNWVMQPVICAFQAVAIPRPSVIKAQTARIDTAVQSGGIGGVKNVINGMILVPIGEGCTGIPIDIDNGWLKIHQRLLAACPGDPLHAVAASTKTILSGVAVSAAAFAVLRYFGVVFGFVGLGAKIEVAQLEAKYRRGAE